jgi:hypothetical protein
MIDPSERLSDEMLAEAKIDEVGLWLIIATLREQYGIVDPARRREITLRVVEKLLASGQVKAGYYNPDGSGIAPWNIQNDDILSRIKSEWDSLARDPNIGEVVIFIGSSAPKWGSSD